MTPVFPAPPISSTSPSSGGRATASKVLVIGIGNRFRRDDGIGPILADRLAARGIESIEQSGEGTALMEAWSQADHVILIDAASSGAPPGTVHRFDAASEAVPAGLFHYSSHQFAVAEAIEMARVLGRMPQRMDVFGIEGYDFSYGEGLSPEVSRSIDRAEGLILAELRENGLEVEKS